MIEAVATSPTFHNSAATLPTVVFFVSIAFSFAVGGAAEILGFHLRRDLRETQLTQEALERRLHNVASVPSPSAGANIFSALSPISDAQQFIQHLHSASAANSCLVC